MHDNEKYLDATKLVDEALRTEPQFLLSDNFADVVAEKANRIFAWEQYLKEFLIYLGVIVGLGIAAAAMALIWFDVNWKNWLDFITSNVGLVAGINIIVVFVLFADRVLLRYFMFKSKIEIT